MIRDEKILITGVTGTVAQEVARFLAADNEVWGVARFADEDGSAPSDTVVAASDRHLASRAELEGLGVTTRRVDLETADFSELPGDFGYVLHLAWRRAGLDQLDAALRTNVEGAGLLLQHCRRAKAALVMSGMGIYSPSADPWHRYRESDPVGRAATAYAPTSPASKLGVEAVARLCARAFDLPIVIPRLNTFNGTPGTFPAKHIEAVLAGREMVMPCDPNPHSPIHVTDLCAQLEAMLDAASVPATIVNWCGDEVVTTQDMMARAADWSGREPRMRVREVAGAPAGTAADPARRRSITGPVGTDFWTEYRTLFDRIAGEGSTSPGQV